jgi:hypothetical protein
VTAQVVIIITLILASVGAVFIIVIMITSLRKAMITEVVKSWTVLPYEIVLEGDELDNEFPTLPTGRPGSRSNKIVPIEYGTTDTENHAGVRINTEPVKLLG